jgi:hypothetical protein
MPIFDGVMLLGGRRDSPLNYHWFGLIDGSTINFYTVDKATLEIAEGGEPITITGASGIRCAALSLPYEDGQPTEMVVTVASNENIIKYVGTDARADWGIEFPALTTISLNNQQATSWSPNAFAVFSQAISRMPVIEQGVDEYTEVAVGNLPFTAVGNPPISAIDNELVVYYADNPKKMVTLQRSGNDWVENSDPLLFGALDSIISMSALHTNKVASIVQLDTTRYLQSYILEEGTFWNPYGNPLLLAASANPYHVAALSETLVAVYNSTAANVKLYSFAFPNWILETTSAAVPASDHIFASSYCAEVFLNGDPPIEAELSTGDVVAIQSASTGFNGSLDLTTSAGSSGDTLVVFLWGESSTGLGTLASPWVTNLSSNNWSSTGAQVRNYSQVVTGATAAGSIATGGGSKARVGLSLQILGSRGTYSNASTSVTIPGGAYTRTLTGHVAAADLTRIIILIHTGTNPSGPTLTGADAARYRKVMKFSTSGFTTDNAHVHVWAAKFVSGETIASAVLSGAAGDAHITAFSMS